MSNQKQETMYVITGVSRLTGDREELSGAMTKEQAIERLERYKAATGRQKYPTYTRLRVEPRMPVQLTLNFQI